MARRRLVACVIAVVGLCSFVRGGDPPPPPPTRYTVQFLPPVTDLGVQPVAINDLGHVAGYVGRFRETGEFRQAFLWTPQGGYQFLPALPGSGGYAYATALNNSDEVVGYSGGGIPGAFFWSASTGTLELPAPLGGSPGVATGISDDGIVAINVVNEISQAGRSHFWNKATGQAMFLPARGGDTNTFSAGVNRLGQIVGRSEAVSVIWDHGQAPQVAGPFADMFPFKLISNAGHLAGGDVLYTPGQEGFTELNSPAGGDLAPAILGVNGSGYAVGRYEDDDLLRAFVYTPADGIWDLNLLVDSPVVLREASAINDGGVIVGYSDDGPFILTPIPEPAVLGLLLAVAMLLLRTRLRRAMGAAAAGAVFLAGSASAEYRPVAFTGSPAPGTENGTNFLQFSIPTLSVNGSVAFQAGLAGPGVNLTNDGAIYAGGASGAGGLQLLQRKGAPADPALGPGVKQYVFSKVGYEYGYQLGPAISQGQVASFAYFTGPGIDYTNDTGISAGPIGSMRLVARYGNHAPGTGDGVHFIAFPLPKINGAGQFLLPARVDGPGINHDFDPRRFSNEDGLWYGDGTGPLRLLARAGDPAPAVDGGYLFSHLLNFGEQSHINAAGQVLFPAGLINPLNSNDYKLALYTGTPGNLRKVIAAGDATPGIADPAVRFGGATQSSFNNAGQIAFQGQFSGPGLFSPDGQGIFLATPGASGTDPYSFQFLARSGTTAPGAGDLLFRFFGHSILNDGGRVVFSGSLTPPNNNNGDVVGSGVWTATSQSDLRLLLLNGTHAPGIPNNNVISAFALAITTEGKILLQGKLSGPDVTGGNDDAYYLADTSGTLSPLLREGDMMDPGDGILRPATSIAVFPSFLWDFSNGDTPFNDEGELAFRVTFADNSQAIFVASPGQLQLIPEPGSALLGLTLVSALMARRRRRPTER